MDQDDYRRIADTHYKARAGIARQLRKNANLSMAEIADRLGVSESAISRWETGSRLPRGRTALRWAQILDELDSVQQASAPAAA